MTGNNESPEFIQAPRRANNTPTPVLVLNVGRLALHHGSVGIIRSLGRIGVPVYAVVANRFTPAAVSKYLTGAIIWDTRHLDAQDFVDGMIRIGQRLHRPTIVIPTGDVAAILIAEHAAALERWFLLPQQPAALPRALANKRDLYRLCNRMGHSRAILNRPCPGSISRDWPARFSLGRSCAFSAVQASRRDGYPGISPVARKTVWAGVLRSRLAHRRS